MATESRKTVSGIHSDLENVWGVIDELLGSFGPDDWGREHGPDWVFADLPYHLSYFDSDIVADAIKRGPDVPAAEQNVWATFNDLNAWNQRKFAERAPRQTPQRSVDQMNASRQAVKNAIISMTDADLDRPVFVPICGCGWLNAGMTLAACQGHTWNHSIELGIRLQRGAPAPSPEATHRALGFYNGIALMALDHDQAAKAQFTTVLEFTGPGGGAWTVHVADGACELSEERAPSPDLVLTQSPETFVKTWIGMMDPQTAIQSGEIKVQGMENMAAYAALFPAITPDRVIQPMGQPAPA